MWYSYSIDEVLSQSDVSPDQGLSQEEVRARRDRFGLNKLAGGEKTSFLRMIFSQVNDVLIYILIAAAGISIFLGEISDAVIIAAVVVINAIIGVIQEAKAEQAIEELRKISSPKSIVRREGEVREIDSEEVVPGDIILLDAGRVVPCDVRLFESANMKIEESALTGESLPVEKDAVAALDRSELSLGDRTNMAFMSTIVTYGRGEGVAVATGMDTEIGKIATLLKKEKKETTPLQKRLASFGRVLGFIILGVCGLMFAISVLEEFIKQGMVGSEVLFEFFLTSVSLAVAAIPEGMVAVVTIVLALGVRRMSRRNAIVRRLPAVETLGSVTIICSDKTGTLTQNKMTVTRFCSGKEIIPAENFNQNDASHRLLAEAMVLCNDATYSETSQTGDPTETALVAFGLRNNMNKDDLEKRKPRVWELPFDSVRKRMSTVHTIDGEQVVYTKGALDSLLSVCNRLYDGEGIKPLTEEAKEELKNKAEEMSADALRVLGAAYRPLNEGAPSDSKSDSRYRSEEFLEKELVFIGFVGMMDPPRLEVKESIRRCRKAGIVPVMITGDHKQTAFAIAKELEIADDLSQAASGLEIDAMSDEELQRTTKKVRVFARVSPEHKVRIVSAFQAEGNIVSMTGDGVNDAPSLQGADIGVAMGITGTDVAKGASDMVLTDDNFETIVTAVEEGRKIFANIQKVITFLLSCNTGEVVAVFTAMVAGIASPLRPIHILWVNLITDTFPALALGVDPGESDVLSSPPRDPDESLFAGGRGRNIIFSGSVIGAVTLLVYFLDRRWNPGMLTHSRTMAFAVLSISQLFHAFDLRSFNKPLLTTGLFTNTYLIWALFFGIGMQMLIIMVPPFASVFDVVPLSGRDLLLVLGFSLVPFAVNESRKLIFR